MTTIKAEDRIYRYLSDDGTAAGNKNATGNYSVTPQDFYFTATRECFIERMIVSLRDTQGMAEEDYGNLTGALANGWVVEVKDASDNVLLDLCDGVPVTTNGDLSQVCFDADVKSWGVGNERLPMRWTFTKDAGSPLFLETGQKLVVTLNDDFTGLLGHYFSIRGHWRYASRDSG